MIFGDKSAIKPHEAFELFWLLFELNVVPMATWSFDGAFLNANQAMLDLLGYSSEEFAAKEISWKALTPPEYIPLDNQCIEELQGQHIASSYEKEYLRSDGERVRVRVHNASHDLGSSKKGVVIAIALD